MRPRLVQQHRCAPRRQTPGPPLHSPHRHHPSACSLTVKSLKFQIPRWKEGPASEERVGAKYAPQRQPLSVCERHSVCLCQGSSFTPRCLEKSTTGRRRCQASPGCSSARGHSSRRSSAGERVPAHSAIMMLTGEEAGVINR